jgi:hypothetical protein
MIDFGYDAQQAAEMPRWKSTAPGQEANYPHDAPDALSMETRFSPEILSDLAARGHNVETVGDLDGPCSIEIIRRQVTFGRPGSVSHASAGDIAVRRILLDGAIRSIDRHVRRERRGQLIGGIEASPSSDRGRGDCKSNPERECKLRHSGPHVLVPRCPM